MFTAGYVFIKTLNFFVEDKNVSLKFLYYSSALIIENANINIYGAKIMNQEFLTVAALLGLTGEKAKEDLVSAKIQELIKTKKDFDTIKSEHKALTDKFSALSTELEGSKASVQNLTKNLQDAQDALEVYKTAEKNARTASINA